MCPNGRTSELLDISYLLISSRKGLVFMCTYIFSFSYPQFGVL